MNALSHHDLQWILQRTPPKLLALMKERAGKLFMAGGFIRACIAREEAADIDLFVPSKDEAKSAADFLAKKEEGDDKRNRVYETDNAYTVKGYGLPLQLIHRWTFEQPEQCIASFDFTIAAAAIWWSAERGWASLCGGDFYSDLAAKRLVYTSPVRNEDAGGSMLRVLKFYQRGYRIPLSSLGAVMARMVCGIGADEVATIQRIGGGTTEQATAFILTRLLREVDPAIDPKHLAHLPDAPNAEKEVTQP